MPAAWSDAAGKMRAAPGGCRNKERSALWTLQVGGQLGGMCKRNVGALDPLPSCCKPHPQSCLGKNGRDGRRERGKSQITMIRCLPCLGRREKVLCDSIHVVWLEVTVHPLLLFAPLCPPPTRPRTTIPHPSANAGPMGACPPLSSIRNAVDESPFLGATLCPDGTLRFSFHPCLRWATVRHPIPNTALLLPVASTRGPFTVLVK